jgi:hypothetical protein
VRIIWPTYIETTKSSGSFSALATNARRPDDMWISVSTGWAGRGCLPPLVPLEVELGNTREPARDQAKTRSPVSTNYSCTKW